jgi:hypothetical protein
MAKEKTMLEQAGKWAFLAGVLIALAAGLVTLNATLVTVLMVLGLLVGFLNVSPKEAHGLLLAGVSLVIVASLSGDVFAGMATVGPRIQSVFSALLSFVTPMTLVVALVSVWGAAKE